jgi:hypothetical protein
MTDAAGRPWVSPVFFAADGYRDLDWISAPQATPHGTWPSGPRRA